LTRIAKDQLARLFIAGYPGPAPAADILDLIRAGLGGVILFERNLPDLDAALAATAVLVEAAGSGPLILSLDQEGGQVQRLGPPFLQLPPMASLGQADDPDLCEACGRQLGLALAAAGFHLDFAPVFDVNTNPDNPVIGPRAFHHADPERVARLGVAFARGLQAAGVGACAKHFPGHGQASEDSHLTLPRLPLDRARLERVELPPFRRAVLAGVATAMTAHLLIPALDERITSLSPAVYALLRDELGFEGPVVTDDLEMAAVAERVGVVAAAVEALAAGADGVLVCHRPGLVEQALAEVDRALADGRLDPEALERSLARWDRFAGTFDAGRRRPDPARLADLFASRERRALQARLQGLA